MITYTASTELAYTVDKSAISRGSGAMTRGRQRTFDSDYTEADVDEVPRENDCLQSFSMNLAQAR